MTILEIKMAVAKALQSDSNESQRELAVGLNKRHARSELSGYPSLLSRLFPELFFNRFGRKVVRKTNTNDVEKQWSRSVTKSRKHKLTGSQPPIYYPRQFVIDIAKPTVRRVLRLINRVDQTIKVAGNTVSGSKSFRAVNSK